MLYDHHAVAKYTKIFIVIWYICLKMLYLSICRYLQKECMSADS